MKAPPTSLTKVTEPRRFFSSRLLVKSAKDLRAEAAKYDQLLQCVRQATSLSPPLTAWTNRCPFCSQASGRSFLARGRSFGREGRTGEVLPGALLEAGPGFLSCVSAQVRALWAAVDGLICSVAAQREGLDSVLQGQVDQHVLDGTGRALKVPRRLQEQVEQLPQVRLTPASALLPQLPPDL